MVELNTLGNDIRTALGAFVDTDYVHGGDGDAAILSPMSFGAIGDGDTHPLSERFASLAAAQAVYPHAVALTDEIDWCAWQALADYAYTRSNSGGETTNWANVTALVNGHFVVNRTITFNVVAAKLIGTTPQNRVPQPYGSAFTYNGADGTIDVPVWIIDTYLFDENEDPPTGRNGNAVASGGTIFVVEGVTFIGKNGSMTAGVGDESGYVSGIRLRKASFSRIIHCNFGGTLWDAITITDAQLFLTVDNCFFYGVYRDAIAILSGGITFSTTCWFSFNEFGYVGRYGVLADFRGSIDADIRVTNNSVEQGGIDFFHADPDWWVNGVVTPVCILEGGNSILHGNRFENGTDSSNYLWADIHLVGGHDHRITGGVARNLFLSALKSSAPENAALTSYKTTYGYKDITNTRNYNCGDTGDSRNGCQSIHVEDVYLISKVYATPTGWGSSGTHSFKNLNFHALEVPVSTGTYADQVGPRASTQALYRSALYAQLENTTVWSTGGCVRYQSSEQNEGRAFAKGDESFTGNAWTATTAVVAHTLTSTMASVVRPTTYNGYIYQATVAGTTGGTEPTWPTTIGNTVADGTVTWTCVATTYATAFTGANEKAVSFESSKRIWRGTAAPTAGRHGSGDMVWNTAPSAGGVMGWVCTASGEPGTWKTMGTIAS